MFLGLEQRMDEVTCVGSSEPHKLGPIDKWTRAIDPKATKSEYLKQQKQKKSLTKMRMNIWNPIEEDMAVGLYHVMFIF